MDFVIPKDLEDFNRYGEEYLFGYLGMELLKVEEDLASLTLWRQDD